MLRKFLRWLTISLEETISSSIIHKLSEVGRKVLAIILFGSFIFNPRKAKDVDVIVVIDNLKDIHEKLHLENTLSLNLTKIVKKKVDVLVFDLNSFEENLCIGSVLSGLVLGYKVLHKDSSLRLEDYIQKLLEEVCREGDYVYVKNGRRINLSKIACTKLRR